MHIVDVMSVIPFILDQMLPIAPLPDPAFAAGALSCRQYFGLRQASDESELDDFPAQGEIGVAIRERPDAMHVVGQNDPGVDVEGMA